MPIGPDPRDSVHPVGLLIVGIIAASLWIGGFKLVAAVLRATSGMMGAGQ